MRFFLIIIILVAIPGGAKASLLRQLCAAGARALRPSSIKLIDASVAKGMPSEPWREDAGAAELVDQASTVAPGDRKRLIAGGVAEKTRGELLHLALHEPAAWDRFIDRIAAEGMADNHLFQSLQPAVESMPAELKDRLAKKVGALFDRVEKKLPGRIGPRRALESFLRAAYPADAYIEQRVKAGASPMEAVAGYQQMMRDKVFASTSRTAYSVHDIGTTVLATLYTLRDHCKKVRAAGGKIYEPNSIILYGSFMNGFAAKGSDLDAMTTSTDLKVLAGPINANVAHMLALRGTRQPPQIDPDTFFIAAYQDVMATYSPFMFEIKENEVKLLVYPAKIERNHERQEEVKSPPLTYTIFPK